MGQKLTYKCKKCGYSTMTSAGLDWGFLAVVETHICLNCKEVVDVLVGEHGNAIPKEELNLYPDKTLPDSDFYKCPICGDEKELVKWSKRKRPCPKCGGRMDVDPDGEFVLWD